MCVWGTRKGQAGGDWHDGGSAGYRLYHRAKEMNNKKIKNKGKRALEKRFTSCAAIVIFRKKKRAYCARAR